MQKLRNSFSDSAEHAAKFLNEALDPKSEPTTNSTPPAPTDTTDTGIDVDEARQESPILASNDRQSIRLCIFTKDISVLDEGSPAYLRVVDGQNLFLETHVVLIGATTEKKDIPPIRLLKNVWVYTLPSLSWWRSVYRAYTVVCEQLSFSGGFRADMVIADDLFEAGLAGWFVSKKFKRPLQLHIYDDFFDESFLESHPHPLLYSLSMEYLLRCARSIRTKTELQRQAVIAERSKLESTTELLPSYYSLSAWQDFAPTVSLREMYPQFKFIVLHISLMNAGSHTDTVMNATARLLRQYPTVGLVIVGTGPLRSALERRAISLGIEKQVEFLPMPAEIISYMKSANVLIHLSLNSEEDEILLEAAATKLPIIASTEGLAGKLFVDNDSACLCPFEDTACVSDRLNQYLNENQERASFALNAHNIVFDRIEQDYDGYLDAYRASIERCIVDTSNA